VLRPGPAIRWPRWAGLLAPAGLELADARRGHRRAKGAGQALRDRGRGISASALRSIFASREQGRVAAVHRSVRGALHRWAPTRPEAARLPPRRCRAPPTTATSPVARGGVDPGRLPRAVCAEDPHFMNELAKGLFFLGPPTAGRPWREAITPARRDGRLPLRGGRWMIDDHDPAPRVDAGRRCRCCSSRRRSSGRARGTRGRKLLTKQSYGAAGPAIAGALVSHADRVISKMPQDLQALGAAAVRAAGHRRGARRRLVREIEELARDVERQEQASGALIETASSSRACSWLQTGGGSGGCHRRDRARIADHQTGRRCAGWLDESQEDSPVPGAAAPGGAPVGRRMNPRQSACSGAANMVDELSRFQRRYRGELADVVRAFLRRGVPPARPKSGPQAAAALVAMAGPLLSVMLLAGGRGSRCS